VAFPSSFLLNKVHKKSIISTMTEERYGAYSDDDSSVEAPPPPPSIYLEEGSAPRSSGQGNHPYEEQLKIFQGMADYRDNPNPENNDDDDDGSVEVPPPADLMERNNYKDADGSKRRQTMVYGGVALCLLVIISIVLGVGFGTGVFKNDSSSKSSVPAPAPDSTVPRPTTGNTETPTDPQSIRVREYMETVVSNAAVFDDSSSPEAKALLWLQTEDPLSLDSEDFASHLRLQQRYALMTLWFSSEFEWFDQTNWKDANECEWFGVTCQMIVPAGRSRNLQESQFVVTRLSLEANNLQGSIPRDLSLLEFLLRLNLSANKLTGSLHHEMGELEFLEELYLNNNEMSGNLENLDLSLMENLDTLDLSFNQFSGELPDTFWELVSLERLVLDGNQFSGSISADIAFLDSLSKWK
jgi:hypothetical protein